MYTRPMIMVTVSYIIGILWGIYLHINIFPLCCVIFVLNIYFNNNKTTKMYNIIHNKKYYTLINICLIIAVLSNLYTVYKTYRYDNLYKDIEEVDCYGIIVGVSKQSEYYNNYIVKVKTMNNEKKYVNTKILLKVKKSKNGEEFNSDNLKYGDYISFQGSFELPTTQRNYKGYNYSEYLKTQDIYGTCKSEQSSIIILKSNSCFITDMWIHKLRDIIKNNLFQILPYKSATIASAILIGDSSQIDDIQKEVFSNASLSHILAISGMHVTYVILGCSVILKKFNKRKGRYILIIFLFFFAQLTGSSPSVVRAVIMSILAIISKLVYRKSDTINNISISCFIILILNPYDILNLGFQLSFLGTLGIVLFNKKVGLLLDKFINKVHNKILVKIFDNLKTILTVSISANILIFPIMIYKFNSVSFIFLISNILVTPILGIMSFCGYATSISSLISLKIARVISLFFNIILQIFNKIAEICSNINFASFIIITPNITTIIFLYVLIIYCFFFYTKKHNIIIKKIFIFLMSVILIINIVSKYNANLSIHFIDVGQGDSTLIITKCNKKILIDGGGSESGDYDVGKNVLLPYLLDRKIKKIDYVIFSHFDADHALGLAYILDKLEVSNIILTEQLVENDIYRDVIELAKQKKIKLIYVKAGDVLNIGDVKITILHPQKELITNNPMNSNSIVFKLQYKSFSILFTGDIEKETEELILSKNIDLKVDVLKVAHHGSKTSTIQEFLNAVKPKIALIGVGKNNKFGHPNNEVLKRIEYMGTKIFRTDENGEISIIVNKRGKIVKLEKCISSQ